MRCSVSLRGGTEELVDVVNPGTVGDLRRIVLEMLRRRPINVAQHGRNYDTTMLEGQEILILQNKPLTLLEDNNSPLCSDTKYFAFEKFSVVPVDLYRTVKLSQIHPAVRATTPSRFTKVVPLYCAAFENKESKYPPYYCSESEQTEEGRVLFRGASLQCCDRYTEVAEDIMPWDEVTRGEDKTGRRVDLEVLEGTSQDGMTAESFGALRPPKLYGPTGFEKFDRKQLKEEKRVVKTRSCYWRFKLPKGTNLDDVGMSVVCDKVDGHFSLIPNGDRSHSFVETISPARTWLQPGVEHLIEPDPNVPAPPPPEAYMTILFCSSQIVVTFPVVAQKFHFHDLVMKTTGLPWDMDSGGGDDDNQDKKKLGVASNVVFEYSDVLPNTYDILYALEALSTSEFNGKSVSTFDFDLLHSAMDDLQSTDDMIDETESEILIAGMGVIEKLLRTRAGGTPTLAEAPYDGPLTKVARTE